MSAECPSGCVLCISLNSAMPPLRTLHGVVYTEKMPPPPSLLMAYGHCHPSYPLPIPLLLSPKTYNHLIVVQLNNFNKIKINDSPAE